MAIKASDTMLERWQSKVKMPPNNRRLHDCWIWQAGCNGMGYPCLSVPGGTIYAHVAAYILFIDPEYTSKKHRLIRQCGNHLCVSPHHIVKVRKLGGKNPGDNETVEATHDGTREAGAAAVA